MRKYYAVLEAERIPLKFCEEEVDYTDISTLLRNKEISTWIAE